MCTKTYTKMLGKDYAGFGKIPLDSSQIHEIFLLKHREMRAITTSASNPNRVCGNDLRNVGRLTSSKSSSR